MWGAGGGKHSVWGRGQGYGGEGVDGKTEGIEQTVCRDGETKRGEGGGGEDGEQRETTA